RVRRARPPRTSGRGAAARLPGVADARGRAARVRAAQRALLGLAQADARCRHLLRCRRLRAACVCWSRGHRRAPLELDAHHHALDRALPRGDQAPRRARGAGRRRARGARSVHDTAARAIRTHGIRVRDGVLQHVRRHHAAGARVHDSVRALRHFPLLVSGGPARARRIAHRCPLERSSIGNHCRAVGNSVRVPAAATVNAPGLPRHEGEDHRHILTVAIEDYYQGATFNRLIPRARWHRFESRLVRNTQTTLDLLDEYKVRATFFALGWVADAVPELIREVVARGHDIASKGYFHRAIREFSRDEFRDDCARAREALERASGRSIDGYRVAQRWLKPEDLWALDVLAEEGYKFDSSIRPLFRQYVHEPWRRFVHQHHHGERTLWEVPVSSAHVMGLDIPIAGANYFRQLPFSLVERKVRQWDRKYDAPFVMYFHVWELDPDQPKIDAAPFYAKIRQYRNLDRMSTILRHYLDQYRFTSIGDRLGIESRPASAEALAAYAMAEANRQEELRNAPAVISTQGS